MIKKVTCSFLNFKDWKIIKEINIISSNDFGQKIIIGKVIYTRNYIDYQNNNSNTYPQDEVDNIILSSITDKFPESFVSNGQINTDNDLDRFNHSIKRPKEKAILEIRPNFSNISLTEIAEQSMEILRIEINIYQEFTNESIKNKYFTGVCNYQNINSIYEVFSKIEFK